MQDQIADLRFGGFMKVKAVKKVNPRNTDETKYYLAPVYAGEMSLDELAELISDASTVNVADVAAVLKALAKQLPIFLQKGFIIELGDFGRLRLSISTDGKENADELSANDIIKVRIIFVPSAAIKEKLKSTSFTMTD